MSASQPPTENLPSFNSSVFKDANTDSFSLSKAQSLFLGRTGTANSVATTTTFSGSIVTSANISVNGLTVGQSSLAAGTTLLGVNAGAVLNSSGANNTLIGNGTGALITSGSVNTLVGNAVAPNLISGIRNTGIGPAVFSNLTGSSNVAVGYVAGNNVSTASNTTSIGTFANTGNNANSTCLGSGSTCSGSNATAIGYNSTAVANQITLGTTGEFVTCKGTTANGSLQLASNLRLQTAYTASPAATMLGQQITGSTSGTTFVTGVGTGTANITTIPLPSGGVWSIDYSVELTVNTSGLTVSIQSLYCSLTSAGTFAQRISNSGIIRTHSSIVYASGDNPVLSGSFVYYVSTATTVYPVFSITTTAGTGSMTGSGFYTATRVG